METDAHQHMTWTLLEGVAVVRFHFSRRYDLGEYEEIGHGLKTVAAAEGVQAVLLNLDSVEHVSSRFLGILLAFARQLSSEGRALAVCRLRPQVLHIFKLCRADALIDTYAGEEEARTALKREGV